MIHYGAVSAPTRDGRPGIATPAGIICEGDLIVTADGRTVRVALLEDNIKNDTPGFSGFSGPIVPRTDLSFPDTWGYADDVIRILERAAS